jgi:hypothetical protein
MNDKFRAFPRFEIALPERNAGAGSTGGSVTDSHGLDSVIGENDRFSYGGAFPDRTEIDDGGTQSKIRRLSGSCE